MKKILVIDDDKMFCELMQTGLDKSAYEVTIAADGVEGLEKLKAGTPDLILLDVRMPRMDGMEFLQCLKTEAAGTDIPVLITSNDSSLDTISKGTELGIRGYIVKSNESMKNIIASIERVLTEKK